MKRPNNKDFQPEIEILGSPYSQLPKFQLVFSIMLDSHGKRTFAFLLICHQGLGQIINITMVNNTFYPISQTQVYLGFDLWVRM